MSGQEAIINATVTYQQVVGRHSIMAGSQLAFTNGGAISEFLLSADLPRH